MVYEPEASVLVTSQTLGWMQRILFERNENPTSIKKLCCFRQNTLRSMCL